MINIFAKEAFLNINPSQPFRLRTKPIRGGHLQRVSSMIRGDQIADQIGAKFNPETSEPNDINIYVKPRVEKGADFEFKEGKNYIDIVDGHNLGQVLINHPDVGCIVCSKSDEDVMKSVIPNKVVLIPQHHCNFDRVHRETTQIKKIGIIGELPAFHLLPEGLEVELEKRKIELVKFSKFYSRQDIINFYMDIDLQIVWRPYKKLLSNPLKIVNASSFGIPTIALDEEAFKEMEGCYMPAKTLDEFLICLDELVANPELYLEYSGRCIEKSEEYHIECIGELYKQLK